MLIWVFLCMYMGVCVHARAYGIWRSENLKQRSLLFTLKQGPSLVFAAVYTALANLRVSSKFHVSASHPIGTLGFQIQSTLFWPDLHRFVGMCT